MGTWIFDSINAAKWMGVSPRHFRKLTEEDDEIQPQQFEGSFPKNFWLLKDLIVLKAKREERRRLREEQRERRAARV